jgi:4-amino-4-deoxy-L-arabinose transferase-like glycosyltransferase
MVFFVLALIVRVACLALHHGAPIEMDGAEYARMGESIRSGNGIIGIRGDALPAFSPFYPLLISVFSHLSASYEAAGIVVSVLAGAALVFPLYGIGTLLHNKRVGGMAAATVALLPFLAVLSTKVLSESLYLLLSMIGLWALLHAMRHNAVRPALAAGVALAGAYLTRPEGVLLAAVGFVFLGLRGRIGQTLVFLAAFLLCVSPYIISQYRQTGGFSPETKSALNYTTGRRLGNGMSYDQAADEVGNDLTEVGTELMPTTAHLERPSVSQRIAFGIAATRAHWWFMLRILCGRSCGGVVLFALALWGALISPWDRKRAEGALLVWSFAGAACAASATVWHFWARYDAPFVPFLVLWFAYGVYDISRRWAIRGGLNPAWIAAAIVGCIFMSAYVSEARIPVSDVEREAGVLLKERMHMRTAPVRPKIMETTDIVSYYSGGIWRPLPYANARTALRYIARIHPDYVVISAKDQHRRPYLTDWVAHGIPSHAFVRVLDLRHGKPDALRVYEYMP